MRKIGITLAVLGVLGALVIAGSVALIESEEVVVLETRDADGDVHRTRIWVIDHLGSQWVTPGNSSNAWFHRLIAEPRVEMIRGGHRNCYVAAVVQDAEALPVLERIIEKYASVMRVTTLLNFIIEPGDEDPAMVAVRLDPC